jgi:hypothetical protein
MKRHLWALALLALSGCTYEGPTHPLDRFASYVADAVDAAGGWPVITTCSGRGSNFTCVSQ